MSYDELGIPGPEAKIVIVGAGIAGLRTALTLRGYGFEGSITLLNAERHDPYDRPPLSKSVLVTGEEGIVLDPRGELAANKIEVISCAKCIAIDRSVRVVELEDGERRTFDRLVIATGSSIRILAEMPPGTPGIHYLRTLDDARGLRKVLGQPSSFAIVGAGVIGLEVAASLRGLGHRVCVIDPASRVMARSASPPLGAYLQQRHINEGVDLRLETSIASYARCKDGIALMLRDGSEVIADQVVVGIGVIPNSDLGTQCGLETVPQGIVVDASGRTSDPAIYAAGEVAYHRNVLLGRHDRQETWAHAAAHGEHVAKAIMGCTDGYSELSSYWTDQYDLNVQVFGAAIGERDIVRGDITNGGLIFHLVEARVAGVTAINAVRELRAAKKLVGRSIDPDRLADISEDIKQLA